MNAISRDTYTNDNSESVRSTTRASGISLGLGPNQLTWLRRNIDSFKHLYGANWVSTGASKGGITATYHSYFFPHDLDGVVAYVAPASRSRVDANYQIYLDSRLTSTCAQGIRDVQVAALTTRKAAMTAKIGAAVCSMEIAPIYLDLMDASFDWGFWQYYGQGFCNRVTT
jgi:hypothetical protein